MVREHKTRVYVTDKANAEAGVGGVFVLTDAKMWMKIIKLNNSILDSDAN